MILALISWSLFNHEQPGILFILFIYLFLLLFVSMIPERETFNNYWSTDGQLLQQAFFNHKSWFIVAFPTIPLNCCLANQVHSLSCRTNLLRGKQNKSPVVTGLLWSQEARSPASACKWDPTFTRVSDSLANPWSDLFSWQTHSVLPQSPLSNTIDGWHVFCTLELSAWFMCALHDEMWVNITSIWLF